MMNKKAACLFCAFLLASCANKAPTDSARQVYHDIGNVRPDKLSINGVRHQALRDSALSLGARAGLAWRAKHINAEVERSSRTLDRVYNFNALMLENYVMPPVLVQARQTFDKNSDDTIRIADRQYSIIHQAKFVTAPPTWRDYLILRFEEPENPDRSLLPRNSIEKKVWDHFIDMGWQAGISQADNIFQEHLGRLTRDSQGMILYRTLLAQNMVSPPFVSEINFGVTSGEDSMAINDRMLRITTMPEFNQHSENWEAEIVRARPKG